MIYLALAGCWALIGMLHYDTAIRTDMTKREQLTYSIAWPWLYIAFVGCFLWDYFFPID